MSTESSKNVLKQDLRRLLRSMDFVSKHPALKKDGPQAGHYAEIYQQLGLAWQFLGLQCRHRDGWRKVSGAKLACTICGKIKGTDDHWVLLPSEGKKAVGRHAIPTSKKTFANKQAARVVDDIIEFHGAKLRVEVHNRYRSRLLRNDKIVVADERIVRLEENGVKCSVDTHLIRLRVEKHRRGSEPPFSAFVAELPRKALKRFPVMLEYDRRGRFVGLTIFRPLPRQPATRG